MKNDEILSIVFGETATKELSKILNLEEHPEKSIGYQLPQASQTLSKLNMAQSDAWETPNEWDPNEWERLCKMSYKDRIAHALSFLTIEFKRVQAIEIKEKAPDGIIIQDELYEPIDQDLETPKIARQMHVVCEEVKADKNDK